MEEKAEQKVEKEDDKHFMLCLNENCNTFHVVNVEELKRFEAGNNCVDIMLCDSCKSRRDTFHILQCLSCRTIIDFLPILPGEVANVVYIERCLRCGGTLEDEISFLGSFYKHLHV